MESNLRPNIINLNKQGDDDKIPLGFELLPLYPFINPDLS